MKSVMTGPVGRMGFHVVGASKAPAWNGRSVKSARKMTLACSFARFPAFADNSNHEPAAFDTARTASGSLAFLMRITCS